MVSRNVIGEVLHEVQQTRSSRKNAVILRGHLLQTRHFPQQYLALLDRALVCKKSDVNADRVVRFTALLVSVLDGAEEGTAESASFGAFVDALLRHLMDGLEARDRSVRYRCTQTLACVMSSGLSEIDEDLFEALQTALLDRVRDRESGVRVQAVVALSRFQADLSDDAEEEDESATRISEVLLHLLQHDPSAEVRRAVLAHLNQSGATLPFLLERARDADPVLRKQVYSNVMPAINGFKPLSISKRNRLLEWGLLDRDASVRRAAERMFGVDWLNLANGSILELLQRLDIANSKVNEDAVRAFLAVRPEFVDGLAFGREFWEELGPESCFLARCVNDHCGRIGKDISDKLPELSALSELIHRHVASTAAAGTEELRLEGEFVVENLLKLVGGYDLSDEIGRRRVVQNVREIMRAPEVSDELTKTAAELLARLTCSEAEYAEIVRELVTDLYDELEEDASFHSASSEQRPATSSGPRASDVSLPDDGRYVLTTLKCLSIVSTLLAHVEQPPSRNKALEQLLSTVVQPAIRSHQGPIRERALGCLGLACLLDRAVAREHLELFMVCYARGDEDLQITALRTLTDVLLCHPALASDEDALLRVYLKAFASESEDVQACAVLGCSKLLLFGRIVADTADARGLLREMCALYYDPASFDRHALKQSLAYFFPCYALSAAPNMRTLAAAVVPTIRRAAKQRRRRADDDESDDEGVPLSDVVAQLLDWTNPLKRVDRTGADAAAAAAEDGVQVEIASEMLKRLHLHDPPREEYRALVGGLTRCHLPLSMAPAKVAELATTLEQCVGACGDAVAKRGLARFAATLDTLERQLGDHEDDDGEAAAALDGLEICDSPSPVADAEEQGEAEQEQVQEEEDDDDEEEGESEWSKDYR